MKASRISEARLLPHPGECRPSRRAAGAGTASAQGRQAPSPPKASNSRALPSYHSAADPALTNTAAQPETQRGGGEGGARPSSGPPSLPSPQLPPPEGSAGPAGSGIPPSYGPARPRATDRPHRHPRKRRAASGAPGDASCRLPRKLWAAESPIFLGGPRPGRGGRSMRGGAERRGPEREDGCRSRLVLCDWV